MAHSQKLLPALKQALPALAGALSLVLAAPLPASADIASPGGGRNPCQRIQPQALLDGAWTAQTPQGPRTIRFSQNRYVQTVNGQLIDEGFFQTTPDGRFLYQVTGGPYAGQQGANRYIFNGQTFTMIWDGGQVLTFVRQGQDPAFTVFWYLPGQRKHMGVNRIQHPLFRLPCQVRVYLSGMTGMLSQCFEVAAVFILSPDQAHVMAQTGSHYIAERILICQVVTEAEFHSFRSHLKRMVSHCGFIMVALVEGSQKCV